MFSSAHVLEFGPREVHIGPISDLRPRISIIFRAGSVFNVENGQSQTENGKTYQNCQTRQNCPLHGLLITLHISPPDYCLDNMKVIISTVAMRLVVKITDVVAISTRFTIILYGRAGCS